PLPPLGCPTPAQNPTPVAAIVRSGLHIATDAYTLPRAGHPRRASETRLLAAVETFARSSQSREDGVGVGRGIPGGGGGGRPGHERARSGGRSSGRERDGGRRSRVGALGAAAAAATAPPALEMDVDAGLRQGGAAGPPALEESAGRARKGKREMRAMTRGLNSITAYAAYGARREANKIGRISMAEETMLVEEVKILSRYLKAREQLEMELGGREPTRDEWASSLGISTEELARQMVVSARAQERIVEANVGLIYIMARRHHPATMARGSITSDVIQEGSLALLRAAETFDPRLGYRFSTYAGWWVRDRVTRCVTQQARIIRLPQY
ncbi:unnamed protein product, partial [Hapterophycus canaliculatus]